MAILGGLELLGPVASFASKIADKIWPDKVAQEAERQKFELAVMELTKSGALDEMKVSLSAILAEANSADPWTSRARPTFLYVMYIMILMSIPMGILSAFRPEIATAIATGMKAWLGAIPEELYALFGVVSLGYVGARSWEKRKGVAK